MEGQNFEESFTLTVFEPLVDEEPEIESPFEQSNSTIEVDDENSTNTTESV